MKLTLSRATRVPFPVSEASNPNLNLENAFVSVRVFLLCVSVHHFPQCIMSAAKYFEL